MMHIWRILPHCVTAWQVIIALSQQILANILEKKKKIAHVFLNQD